MTSTSKVAIIGLGNIGQAVAVNLSKSNQAIIVADRNADKASALSANWGPNAQAEEISLAVKNAKIVVLAIPFEAIVPFITEHAADLEGKIIIDPSNPIAPSENGGFKKIIEQSSSAGEINMQSLPSNAKLVKALGSLGVGSLISAAYQAPEKSVLFYANNDTTINDTIEQLINDLGFDPVRIGGLDQSIRIEVFGDLHEFGALGKTVTKAQAVAKL